MHANTVNVLALLAVATSVAPTLAAPLSTIELIPVQPSHSVPALAIKQRSAAAIGKALADGAVEGLSAGAAEAALDKVIKVFTKREVADLDARSLSAIEHFLSNVFRRDFDIEERSAAAIGKAVAAGLASGALEGGVTSLVNKFTRRDLSEPEARSLSAIENFFGNFFGKRGVEERSAAAIGKAVAAGLASGALEAGVTSLVDKFTKRGVEERSAAAIGKALADGAIEGLSAGAAEAALDKVIKVFTKRDVGDLDARSLSAIEHFLSNVFRRDFDIEERSAAAIGKAVAAGLASGALEGGVTSLVNKFTRRDLSEPEARSLSAIENFFGNFFHKRGVEERSAAAIGKAVAAGLASGALEGGVTSLVGKFTRDVPAQPEARSFTAIGNFFKSIFGRDFEERAVEERSAAAIGKAVAAGLASGALEGGVTGLVNKLTGRAMGDIFVDDSTGIIYADMDDETAASNEKRAVGAILKGLASGAGGGILKGLYNDLTDRTINELD